MSEIKYINNRDIQEGNNFLTNFRHSASIRIFRFPLEYCTFQTLLTYGIVYNGFGIHTYYLQKTGAALSFGPWARMKSLGSIFGKYFVVALPFFYLKEVFFSLSYMSTREKPQLRKLFNHSFIQNIFSMVATFPIFYYMERNLTKSLRGCLVLGVYSLLNDLFIEKRRLDLISRSFDEKELLKKKATKNTQLLKSTMQWTVKDPRQKREVNNFDWDNLRDQSLKMTVHQGNLEELRKEQIETLAKVVREELHLLHKLLD